MAFDEDSAFDGVDPGRRRFLKMFLGAAFVTPVVASFSLDGVAHAAAAPSQLVPNQTLPNQIIVPNQIVPNQILPNQTDRPCPEGPHDHDGRPHELDQKIKRKLEEIIEPLTHHDH